MKVLLTYPQSFVGFSLKRILSPYVEIITGTVDYLDYQLTNNFLKDVSPDLVILNVPFCGGITLNINKPAELMLKNMVVQTNVIASSLQCGVKRLIFIGSSCMYPKTFEHPLKERDLLQGPLEETNSAYSTAKLAGWQMCNAYSKQYGVFYKTIIPANLFGPKDDFDENAHVVSALISRFHECKIKNEPTISIWGSGTPVRDFLFIDDFARAILFLLQNNSDAQEINVGSGLGFSISEIANAIKNATQYKGKTIFDTSKPDGMKVKVLDTSRINNLGWKPSDSLEKGIQNTYDWYMEFINNKK